ncbi:MAG: hypothetical protein ACLBM6_01995 [Cuspidothrix sp.]
MIVKNLNSIQCQNMKLFFLMLMIFYCECIFHKSANAESQPTVTPTVQENQARNLITEPATINSYWHQANQANNELSLSISDPECKKINPINYINNPQSFFQSCDDANNSNRQIYEPVEYLKVPRLDSGIKIKLGDF